MKDFASKALVAVLPLALGFAGGVGSTFFPVQFHAFCAGSL